jgi:hypothetical protein
MKSISSTPGASLFRTVGFIILVSIFIVVFLNTISGFNQRAEKIARDTVIDEINIALAFRLYQSVIDGTLDELPSIHLQNPFVVLSGSNYTVPVSYKGEVAERQPLSESGWYFDVKHGVIFFGDATNVYEGYQLQFSYQDLNGSGVFESASDQIKQLVMIRKN